MSLNITFLGHSGFLLRTESHAVAIDPFLTGNPVATAKPEDIECDYIAITHGHNDHVGDMVSIARANNATAVQAGPPRSPSSSAMRSSWLYFALRSLSGRGRRS
jgi:L-ascorbate metabolism protein UlaG (beta-lactamase superfamily)